MLRVLDPKTSPNIGRGLCALAVMTKAPRAGEVKTRLVPPLTPNEAAEINVCFLHDLATSLSRACLESRSCGVAVYTPVGAEASYEGILPLDFVLVPQRGNNFGERLIFAADDLFKIGFASVCLINSDSPTVPAACFAEAANALAAPGARVAIGPTDDGGYYLIGIKQRYPRMFEEIDWSTNRVFEQTKQRAVELGLRIHELPQGFDVDDSTSLSRLCNELVGEGARDAVASNTRNFVREIIEQEGRVRICPE